MRTTLLTKTLALLLVGFSFAATQARAEEPSDALTPAVSGDEIKTSRDLKQWGKAFVLEEEEFEFFEAPTPDAQAAMAPEAFDPVDPDEDPLGADFTPPPPRTTTTTARPRNQAFAYDRFSDDDFEFDTEVAVGDDPGSDISTLPVPDPGNNELDELDMELAEDLDDLTGELD